MRSPWLPLAGILTLLLSACGGSSSSGNSEISPCTYTACSVLSQHAYAVYEPKALAANAPMLILLHGARVPLDDTETMWQGRAFADRYGYRLVIPLGANGVWNYSSDIQFVADLIDTVQRERGASRGVFVAGWSNGAELSQMLACDHAERINAVVSLAGPLTVGRACTPSRPIGVALLGGTADTLVPISGGGGMGSTSLAAAFSLWSSLNACTGSPVQGANFPLSAVGGSITTTAQGCNAPVQQTIMQDAQHRPQWDTAVLHPMLQDFFTRAAR